MAQSYQLKMVTFTPFWRKIMHLMAACRELISIEAKGWARKWGAYSTVR